MEQQERHNKMSYRKVSTTTMRKFSVFQNI